jgi:hypothetical protein
MEPANNSSGCEEQQHSHNLQAEIADLGLSKMYLNAQTHISTTSWHGWLHARFFLCYDILVLFLPFTLFFDGKQIITG